MQAPLPPALRANTVRRFHVFGYGYAEYPERLPAIWARDEWRAVVVQARVDVLPEFTAVGFSHGSSPPFRVVPFIPLG